MLIYRVFKSITVIWDILPLFSSVDEMVQRVWLSMLMPDFGIKCANYVKLSQIVAIRTTTFCTNYFWNKSKYCVYLLFAPSLLLQFFLTHPVFRIFILINFDRNTLNLCINGTYSSYSCLWNLWSLFQPTHWKMKLHFLKLLTESASRLNGFYNVSLLKLAKSFS